MATEDHCLKESIKYAISFLVNIYAINGNNQEIEKEIGDKRQIIKFHKNRDQKSSAAEIPNSTMTCCAWALLKAYENTAVIILYRFQYCFQYAVLHYSAYGFISSISWDLIYDSEVLYDSLPSDGKSVWTFGIICVSTHPSISSCNAVTIICKIIGDKK